MVADKRPMRTAAERRADQETQTDQDAQELQEAQEALNGRSGQDVIGEGAGQSTGDDDVPAAIGVASPASANVFRSRRPRPDLVAGKSRLHLMVSSPVRYALECARWEFNMSISDIIGEAVTEYMERRGIAVAPVSGDVSAPAAQVR